MFVLQSPDDNFAPIELDRIVGRSEAAAFLGINVQTLDKWKRAGAGPICAHLGPQKRGYTLRAIRDFIRAAETPQQGVA